MLGLTRPDDAWLAYQYDLACAHLGHYCEVGLAETDSKGRPVNTLSALLAEQDAWGRPSGQRYRTDFDRFPVEAA